MSHLGVRGRRGAAALIGLVVLGLLVPLALGSVGRADDNVPTVNDYRGPTFPSEVSDPTADKPQSKVWFAHGSWWGLLVADDMATHVQQLNGTYDWADTGIVVDRRRDSRADVLWSDEALYVLSADEGSALVLRRYRFVGGDRPWRLDLGYPVTLAVDGPISATIARDSTGTLWTSYVDDGQVLVAHSLDGDNSWTEPFPPAVDDTAATSHDISAIVSVGEAVGVMWSDQGSGTFRFALHPDGAGDTDWSAEVAASGFLDVDDHINLQAVSGPTGTTVLAAVKTSLDEIPGVPGSAQQIAVLEREPGGGWTSHSAGTVADGHTQPVIAVDTVNDELYLVAQARGGGLAYKRTPLSDIDFAGGPGLPLISTAAGGARSATTSKQAGTARSGLLFLATAPGPEAYFHAQIELEDGPPDTTAPTPPGLVTARPTDGCQVQLLWPPSSDNDEIRGYQIQRDGAPLDSTADSAYTDSATQCGRTQVYGVAAVDAAGNVSPVTTTDPVTLPPETSSWGVQIVATTSGSSRGGTVAWLPAPRVAEGSVVLASVDVSGATSVFPPPGWRLVRADGGDALTKATYVHVTGPSEPDRHPFRLAAPRSAIALAVAYRGVSPDDPVVAADGQVNRASLEPVAPAIDIDAGSNPVAVLYGVAGLVSITPPPEAVGYMSQGATEQAPRRVSGAIASVLEPTAATGALAATSSHRWSSIGQTVVLNAEKD